MESSLAEMVERLDLEPERGRVGSGRRQHFLPARDAINVQKRDDRKRSGLTRDNDVIGQEQMAKPPSLMHLRVRHAAIEEAYREGDADALRGELINLASYAEVWAEQLGHNPRVRQGLNPRPEDIAPPEAVAA